MVTKAELEAQVAELRRQLADQSGRRDTASARKQAEPPDERAEPDRIVDSLEAWSTQLEDALTELEELPHKKPILFALGIFTLGYLLGRSR